MAVPFTIDKVFDSRNRTVADNAWRSPDLIPETGLVAMPDDWVFSKGLPEAQRFPWDKSKGLYVLNGFHNIHCLVSRQRLLADLLTNLYLAPFKAINPRSIRR